MNVNFENNEEQVKNPSSISNGFCSFFTNIIREMKQKSFPLRDFVWQISIRIVKKTDKHFNFQRTTIADVERCLKGIRRLKSTGLDDLPSCLLKNSVSVMALPQAYIINLSFSTGAFPRRWKNARSVPVHKSGSTSSLGNYRPISILPFLSKIIEKLVHQQLMKFHDENRLLSDFQFGFRPKMSIELAVTLFLDNIRKNVNQGCLVGATFIDLSKVLIC